MTPTEQTRAMLESKGWILCPAHAKNDIQIMGWHDPKGIAEPIFDSDHLLHSLDACHEVFEKDAPDSYWSQLCAVSREQSLWNYMRCGKATC